MHVKMDKVYSFDPEEYANVAPVEDKLDSETQETSEPTKKKPTLRILD